MKTRTKNYLSILTLLTFFVLGIASHPAKNATFSDAANWIPSDFNPNNDILLIETHPVSAHQNERMIDFLEKNYAYRYEVIDRNMIQDKTGKYSDTKTYPFGVLWDLKSTQITRMDDKGKMSFSTNYDLYGQFIDRSTNKVYPKTTRVNNYGQVGYEPFFNSITKQVK